MNINIKTKQFTVTPAISDYVNKRLQKIAKMLGNDPTVQCDIELSKVSEHHQKGDIFRAEVHIVGSGKNLYASSEKSDLYTAIDDVRDEIMGELKSKKDKEISMVRRGGAKVKSMMKGLWPF